MTENLVENGNFNQPLLSPNGNEYLYDIFQTNDQFRALFKWTVGEISDIYLLNENTNSLAFSLPLPSSINQQQISNMGGYYSKIFQSIDIEAVSNYKLIFSMQDVLLCLFTASG